MEERKHITAEWAKTTASQILGEKVKTQINECLICIEGAVKRNEMSVSVSIYADRLTMSELTKRGFTVKQEDDQRDGSYLRISW